MLFRFVLIIVDYHDDQIGWFLRVLMFLSLSILILIAQPYKMSYMNVLDGLLLALAEFQTLLVVTFLYVLPSSNEALPLIFMIASGFPQLVLLMSVTYGKLKGKEIAKYISQKFHSVIKKMCTRIQVENELSDGDSLPHRLVNPNQYNRSLLSESEQTHANSEAPAIQGELTPVYTYGSVS